MKSEVKDKVAPILAKIPSGLFILTARLDENATGMLASWVQQVGFEPPMVMIAVKKNRFVTEWLERHPYFALNQLAEDSKALLKHFGAGFPPEANAFEGISTRETGEHHSIILNEAMGYLECHLAHVFATGGDHDLIVARIIAGELLHAEVSPYVHVRKNGFHY